MAATGEQLRDELLSLLKEQGSLEKQIKACRGELDYTESQIDRLETLVHESQQEMVKYREQSRRLYEASKEDAERGIVKLKQAKQLYDQYASRYDQLRATLSQVQERIEQIRSDETYLTYWQSQKIINANAEAEKLAEKEAAKEGLTPNSPKYRTRVQRLKSAFKKKLLSKKTP